jgi:hypothetical protein
MTVAVPLRRWGASRAGRLVMATGPVILLGFWIVAEPAFGVDLQDWGRNMRQHQDWTSVEFRNPFTGMFVASRAGTEDLKRHATLTLTASPLEGCVASTVVVIELASPNQADVEEINPVSIDIDDLRSPETGVKIVMPRGDRFEFIEIPGPYDTGRLKDRQLMAISLWHVQIARFSLKGFDSAWGEAQRVCQKFLRH